MKHNNAIPHIHLRKHVQGFFKTWFNQAARKRRRLQHRRAKAAALFPRPSSALRPVVHQSTQKYNRKVKVGRGFSLQEVQEAGLGVEFARSVGISVDHRRRNKCQESLDLNKRRLLAYVSKLVLFPRKAGAPKKGLVNDSTGAALENVVQNTEHTLLSTTPHRVTLREKPVKLTKELLAAKAYYKLRLERTNAKLNGKRLKRAADEEGAKDK